MRDKTRVGIQGSTASRSGRLSGRLTRAPSLTTGPARQRRVQGRFDSAPLDRLPIPQPDSGRERGGRRRLPLDDERAREAFLELLRAGNMRSTAAIAVGWSPASVEAWLRRGRGVAGADRPPTERYVGLAKAVRRAEAEAEIRLVATVSAAGQQDWRAALAMLERRWPERWGPQASAPRSASVRASIADRWVYLPADNVAELGSDGGD